jgi:hypothetical protein
VMFLTLGVMHCRAVIVWRDVKHSTSVWRGGGKNTHGQPGGDKNTYDLPIEVEFQGGRHSGMYAFAS